MSISFGEAAYRQGAMERLQEAQVLLRAGQYAGCVYIAGRGVEGMLRAVIWKSDAEIRQKKKSLDTGHDLRELLTLVRDLGLLRSGGRDEEFVATVESVARLWFNNLRFASAQFLTAYWRRTGYLTSRRTLKHAAADFYESCSVIIKRCETLCER